jgi:hypothetical protein
VKQFMEVQVLSSAQNCMNNLIEIDSISNQEFVITAAWDDKVNGRSSGAYEYQKTLSPLIITDNVLVEYDEDEYARR